MNPSVPSQPAPKPSELSAFAAPPALIVFVICLVLGLAAVAWRTRVHAGRERALARAEASARGAAVESQLSQAVTAAEVLGALARQSGGAIANFQKFAAELLAARPGLASLELQPRGVVSEIVPRAGNERVIGFNVLGDPTHRIGAYAAAQKRTLTVTGPIPLYHGEPGIVVRVPVLQKGANGRDLLWGFVAVSMRLADALTRAGLDELASQGYDYTFVGPIGPGQKPITLAARGGTLFDDAARQTVRAKELEFQLAVQRHGGWVNKARVAMESLAVLVVSGLFCLLASTLGTGRALEAARANAERLLAREVAERERMQQESRTAGEATASAQAELDRTRSALQKAKSDLSESQARLDETKHASQETRESLEARLAQAEQEAIDLAARLDAAVRATDEAAKERQAEVARAYVALEQAQRNRDDMQSRLEEAIQTHARAVSEARGQVKKAEANAADLQRRLGEAKHEQGQALLDARTRIEQNESTIAELRSQLDGATGSQKEAAQRAAEADVRANRAEVAAAELQAQLEVSRRSENEVAQRPAEADARTRQAEATFTEVQSHRDALTPSENRSGQGGQAEPMPRAEEASTPPPAQDDMAAPSPPTASDARPQDAPTAERTPSAVQVPAEPAMNTLASVEPEASNRKEPGPGQKRRKSRPDNQLDLFAAPSTASGTPAPVVAQGEAAPTEEPAKEQSSAGTVNETSPPRVQPPTEPESMDGDHSAELGPQPGEPQGTSPEPQTSEPVVATAQESNHPPVKAPELNLPAIEGLATSEGLQRANSDPDRYIQALRRFVEHEARSAARIRDALVLGDTAAAGHTVERLGTAAGEIGAVTVQVASTALERAMKEQSEPAEIESLWMELERALDDMVADLSQALKPEDEKPTHTRLLPSQPPVNLGHLRRAVRLILPLLVGQDPGARDCLKDNRLTFRSAFAPEAYLEFEQSVKSGEFSAALDHLKRAAKKQGITV